MRRIELAVVLAVSLTLAPFAEAQRVPEVGVLSLGTERLSLDGERVVPNPFLTEPLSRRRDGKAGRTR